MLLLGHPETSLAEKVGYGVPSITSWLLADPGLIQMNYCFLHDKELYPSSPGLPEELRIPPRKEALATAGELPSSPYQISRMVH